MKQDLNEEQRARVRRELETLRISSAFGASTRLHRFLEYVVLAEMNGEGADLNQMRIALDVFGRDGTFDPSIDSIVRVEAGRLRSKLGEHYRDAQNVNGVAIELPKGRYSPSFVFTDSGDGSSETEFEQDIQFCRTSDDVSIAYAQSGSGYPLVKAANWLSHLEFDGQSPIWKHWWSELSDRYRLIRYDERGCGLSDWDVDAFTLETWIRDLEEVVDVVGVKRFALLGISQGASVAIEYAAKYPERVSHLIIYGGFVQGRLRRNPTPQQVNEAELLKDLARVGWGGENAAFRKAFATLFVPDAVEEQLAAFDDLQRSSTSARNAALFLDAFNNLEAIENASKVRAKTLVVHARKETEVPVSQAHLIAKLIPGAKLVTLESRNHILGRQEPGWQRFLEEIDKFIGDE